MVGFVEVLHFTFLARVHGAYDLSLQGEWAWFRDYVAVQRLIKSWLDYAEETRSWNGKKGFWCAHR